MSTDRYDPFVGGRYPVGVRTMHARDAARNRSFRCEIWYPAAVRHAPRTQLEVRDAAARPGTYSLIVYSHSSGAHRRAATFLGTHLSSHGYVKCTSMLLAPASWATASAGGPRSRPPTSSRASCR